MNLQSNEATLSNKRWFSVETENSKYLSCSACNGNPRHTSLEQESHEGNSTSGDEIHPRSRTQSACTDTMTRQSPMNKNDVSGGDSGKAFSYDNCLQNNSTRKIFANNKFIVQPASFCVDQVEREDRTKRKVRLNLSTNQVFERKSYMIDDLSECNNASSSNTNHRERIWYSKSDYVKMHTETQGTVQSIQKGLPQRLGLCYRGLEHAVCPGSRRIRVTRALRVVLDRYRSSTSNETTETADFLEEEVAKAYATTTKYCQEIAHQVGLIDAKIAKDILSESGSRDKIPQHPQRRWRTPPASREFG